jgi:hypothetical protein
VSVRFRDAEQDFLIPTITVTPLGEDGGTAFKLDSLRRVLCSLDIRIDEEFSHTCAWGTPSDVMQDLVEIVQLLAARCISSNDAPIFAKHPEVEEFMQASA